MALYLSEDAMRAFYERWGSSVLTFCRLYLGDEEQAELATQEAFIYYLRVATTLDADRIPVALLRHAVDAARERHREGAPATLDSEELEDVLMLLPHDDRAVFIMKNVLEMAAPQVAAVLGITPEQVQRSSYQSLDFLRQFWLKKD